MIRILLAAAAMTIGVSETSIAAQTGHVDFRTECRKGSDRGCSGNNVGVFQAPRGKYIEVVSDGEILNYWMKQPRCHKPELGGAIKILFPGTTASATFHTNFKAALHIESGSGGANIGKVAFLNCRYRYRLGDLPR